jgi:hypothetical protein
MTPRHRSTRSVLVAGLVLVAVSLAACGQDDGDSEASSASETTSAAESGARATFSAEESEATETTVAASDGVAVQGGTIGEAAAPAPDALPLPGEIDPAIVVGAGRLLDRDVTLEVELADTDAFQAAWTQLNAIPTQFAGLVASASVTSTAANSDRDEDAPESGTLSMRVPVELFTEARAAVAALGTVTSESSTTVDVTDQVIDLEARMNALRAVEASYVALLEQANGINEILTVQDRLTGIRTQIEQLQAQQNNIRGEAAYSTITAFITEPAPVDPDAATIVEEPEELTGWAKTWDTAKRGFIAVLGSIVIALVVIAPVIGLAALFALVAWPMSRRRRRLAYEAAVRNRPVPPAARPAVASDPDLTPVS